MLVDRRRLDRWILPAIAVIVILGAARTWWARDARALVVAVLSSAVLIAHRFPYPRKPYYARTMSACFREQPEMKWMLMLFPLAIAGKFICKLSPHLLSDALGWCAAGALFAVQCWLIASMFVRERRRKRRVEANWQPTDHAPSNS